MVEQIELTESVLDSLYGIHLSHPLSVGQEVRGFGVITPEIIANFIARGKAKVKRDREDRKIRKANRPTWIDPWDTLR